LLAVLCDEQVALDGSDNNQGRRTAHDDASTTPAAVLMFVAASSAFAFNGLFWFTHSGIAHLVRTMFSEFHERSSLFSSDYGDEVIESEIRLNCRSAR
jgi:hypothetical protein